MQDTFTNDSRVSGHFKALFDYATMGIVVSDSMGLVTAINPFALKLFGYSEEELAGQSVEILLPPRMRKKHRDHRQKFFRDALARPMAAGRALFGLRKDGSEFPVEISLSDYKENGEHFAIAFISDISIRRNAELEIEKLNRELEATVEARTAKLNETLQQLKISNEKCRNAINFQKAILDHAGAMIIATDEKGIITLFNPEAANLLGYTAEELVGKANPLIFHDKAEIARKREDLLARYGIDVKDDFSVMVERAKRNIHEEEQYTYIRKDGSVFPVSLTITAFTDEDGTLSGFMGIAIDISEREKTEDELRKSLEKEKELNELKSRFVSMASHEFRTPLSTVLSSAYLIEKYPSAEDQPKREKHLQRIVSSVNMLTDILNDFLSVGRIEEGRIQVRTSSFDLHEVVMSLISELKNNLKKGQKISYRHQGPATVMLDPSLLRHIIMNLVSNASKFSHESKPIEIRTEVTPAEVILSIKDHGIGISREDQKHLMERFFRGANAGNIQGTGLGLHIVSRYAELMKGVVECHSELEKGTEFVITFDTKTC